MYIFPRSILTFVIIIMLPALPACSPGKKLETKPEAEKTIPGTVSISPSAFHCEARVLSSDSVICTLNITRMIAQGSSLFYAVGAGDTIEARKGNPLNNFPVGLQAQFLIEERLKLNSDKPEFVIRQMY